MADEFGKDTLYGLTGNSVVKSIEPDRDAEFMKDQLKKTTDYNSSYATEEAAHKQGANAYAKTPYKLAHEARK